jgi:hypothetical protein
MARAKLRHSFSEASPSRDHRLAIIPFENEIYLNSLFLVFMAQSTKWIRHFPKPPPPGIIASAIIQFENEIYLN